MAVQDIQAGVGYLHGIAGSIAATNTEGTPVDLFALTSGPSVNMESRGWTHDWTDEEIPSQDGTIIEACITTKEWREIKITFMPKGISRVNAELADEVITFASSTVSAFSIAVNWQGGMTIDETAEGRVVISFTGRQYKNASGVFAALAKITL
jgi:hypothetical protein